ncbi:hypothetical protein SKAU_G00320930 [Synaphobranchus kaupii]|uniref:RRM domain-containing protein n=1 Tax=Synaphobranchus kaupii TaxID=118154 RepID=A0A9Q1IIV0_SYNKA|nr:hypothetical protein SKAU_G00320930 [Synaphobranchus kaupii]
MVESICNVTEEEFSLEMIRDMNTAIVTFNGPSAAERFLSKCSGHSWFQQYQLKGRVLEPTCSVRVENLPPQAEEYVLELYFENERQGGGRVAGITMIPEEQAAIITFLDPKVAENVLQRKHHIRKVLVSVYPYQQALGTALYGSDRPEWKLPEAFTENLHPALGNFLLQESQLAAISTEMHGQFCQVEFSTEHAKLRPLPGLLKQKDLTANRIEGWRGEASQAFRSIVARYRCFECPVSASVWKAAETEIRQAVSEDAILLPNLSNGVVAIAGFAKDVDRIQKEVEELVQRAANQLERERDGVSEEMVVYPGLHSILQQAGLQSIFTQRYPALSMTYRSDTQSLVLSGLPTEVMTVKSWVLEKILETKNKGVQEEIQSDSADLSQARAVLVENVPEKLSREFLGMMVENICYVTEEEFSLEMIRDMNTAIVTFNEPSAAERFLSKCRGHRLFQQYQLQGRVLEPTCSVRVENLPPQAVEELLELYFEKERQGGGRVAGITMIPEEQAAIITFQDPKVAENVLQRKHHICKVLVSVYPYQQALGTALYGTDRPEWKLPEAFTENLHPALGNFLLQESQLAAISAQMQAQFCQVELSTEHAKLRPLPGLLKQKDLTANRIEGWRGEASQAFRSIVARYRCFECPVSASVWKAAEREIRQAVSEDAVLLPNLSNGVVAIAGLAEDVDRIQKEVEEMVQRAANQLERERDGVSEEMVVSPGLYSILQQAGLQSIFTQKYPALSMTYRSDTQSLVLSGLPTEVITVKSWVLGKKLETKNKGVQEEIQSDSADLSQARAVLVENVPEKLSREFLGMMVENICYVTEEEFSLEMIRDMNTAIVTFNKPSAAEFLSKCSGHSRFQQYQLQGRVLAPTCSVRVENLPPQAVEDLLELYFEKERQGGGRVAGITMIPEEQAAIITFQDPKVAENVLQRKHHICKVLVSVYPYQQALGTALYGSDRLPEAFTENLHPALGNFLLQESQLAAISAQMQAQFCQVELSTEHAKLRPLPGLLKQKDLTANRIEGWRGEASQAFRSIVARYRCFECPVNASVWKAAEREIRQAVSEDAVLLPNLPNGVVAIAGLAKDVDRIQKEVEEMVQRAANQLERERDGVSEEMVVSPGLHSILQQAGLQRIFTQRYPALSMTYRSDTQSLVLSGLPTEVITVKSWVLGKKLETKNKGIKDV